MDSIRAGDNCARIVTESHTTPRNVVLWAGANTLFFVLSLNPRLWMWARKHFNAELPALVTGLESASRQCN